MRAVVVLTAASICTLEHPCAGEQDLNYHSTLNIKVFKQRTLTWFYIKKLQRELFENLKCMRCQTKIFNLKNLLRQNLFDVGDRNVSMM